MYDNICVKKKLQMLPNPNKASNDLDIIILHCSMYIQYSKVQKRCNFWVIVLPVMRSFS